MYAGYLVEFYGYKKRVRGRINLLNSFVKPSSKKSVNCLDKTLNTDKCLSEL